MRWLALWLWWVLLASAEDVALDFELNNGNHFPVVGLGVGNLAHRSIPRVVSAAVADYGVRVLDTAMASANEGLLQETLRRLDGGVGAEVRVVTKIWYTHLGYGRTKVAVEESLRALGSQTKVTMLLHWPYCRDDIAWMRCADEERDLDLAYRRAGPAPRLDRAAAWRGSWKALEEFYAAGRLENIGISNFDAADVADLVDGSRITPQFYQGDVRSFLFDPRLTATLAAHKIVFMAYGVMGGIVKSERAPKAYRNLKALARKRGVPVSALVLRALAQRGVCTIPRASSPQHLGANAPAAVLDPRQNLDPLDLGSVFKLARALLTGVDVAPRRTSPMDAEGRGVVATFRNSAARAVAVLWENAETGERVPVAAPVAPGEIARLTTHPGHRFVAIAGDTELHAFTVTAPRGGWQEFEL